MQHSLLSAGAAAGTKADDFLPQYYNGPTMPAARSAAILYTSLIDTYPARGVAYGLPLHAAANTTHEASRPYKHT